MIIETIAFVGLAVVATTLLAKAYERHQDVLYGPYIQGRVRNSNLLPANTLRVIAESLSSLRWKASGMIYLAAVIAC